MVIVFIGSTSESKPIQNTNFIKMYIKLKIFPSYSLYFHIIFIIIHSNLQVNMICYIEIKTCNE